MRNVSPTLSLLGILFVAACGSKDAPAPAPAPAPVAAPKAPTPAPPPVAALAPADEAKAMFATGGLCFSCHGATGAGDGPAAVALPVKPRAYTDPAWQDSVKDEDIANAIRVGGKALGKSEMMPASPHLSPAVVDELVKLIRGFRKS